MPFCRNCLFFDHDGFCFLFLFMLNVDLSQDEINLQLLKLQAHGAVKAIIFQ